MTAAAATPTDDRAFRRRMALFELKRARDLAAAGRPERAAIALARARQWRASSLPQSTRA